MLKEKPTSYEKVTYSETSPLLNLTRSTFPLTIFLADLYSKVINDDRYFSLKLIYRNASYNLDLATYDMAEETINLAHCNYTDWPSYATEQEFLESGFNTFYCPVKKDFQLFGYWNEAQLGYLGLDLAMCDYEKRPDYCASKSEIEEFASVNGLSLNIYYMDYYTDVQDFSNHIRPRTGIKYKYLDTDKFKLADYIMKEFVINTDKGFLIEDIVDQNYLRMIELQTDQTNMNKEA